MMELSFVIVLSGLLAMYAFSKMQGQAKDAKMHEAVADAVTFVKNGILDSTGGYVNGAGGYCSSDYDFVNISAKRVVQCSGLKYAVTDLGTDTDGTKSYATLNTNTYGSCRAWVDEVDTDNIDVYIDCGTFAGSSTSKKAYLEELMRSEMRKRFPILLKTESVTASGVQPTANAGNAQDGKVRFRLGL